MIHGLDTSFMVAAEVVGHADHGSARGILGKLLSEGDSLALAPQVLAEFIHVVTDPRRFERPLTTEQAVERAERWWSADEVIATYPGEHTASTFFNWLRQYRLGRKRLLDTLLAATYLDNQISSILTTNARDFKVFGCFSTIEP